MDSKKLRSGYTTGTCAQAATKAAINMLFTGQRQDKVEVHLPKGSNKCLDIVEISFENIQEFTDKNEGRITYGNLSDTEKIESANFKMHGTDCEIYNEKKTLCSVSCAVKKDSGDDPDITNGVLVYSRVSKISNPEIVIDGGLGIGRVTKEGLDQPVGAAAINRIPRMMIKKEVEDACEAYGYEGGIRVEISIPEGEKLAEKTFNPRLGIVGGLSILGTSGVVEPMSEQAIKDTIRVEMRVKLAEREDGYLVMAPGNYGLHFLEETYGIKETQVVKCSNYIGESLDMAAELGCNGLVFVGHLGKLVKVSGGIMNTHSKWADCRMELLAAAALKADVSVEVIKEILRAVTTDDALAKCSEKERIAMMEYVMKGIQYHMEHRVADAFKVSVMTFSNVYGILGVTSDAEEMLKAFAKEQEDKVAR